MKGVIDIGSNSVRLMLSEKGRTLEKIIKITKLADGLSINSALNQAAAERTAQAVSVFSAFAKENGADEVYAFATAAVRKSVNGKMFTDRVKELCGIDVDVISGEIEAEIGAIGALNGKDGGIIDIGGASSEIAVYKSGKRQYFYSLDIGTVRLLDLCGQNEEKLRNLIAEKIIEYGEVPFTEFYGIGGTATSLCAVKQELKTYSPSKVDGYKMTLSDVETLASKLISLSVKEREKLDGLQSERAEVIAGGALLLEGIMKKLKLKHITVSEKDNLEGYLIKKESAEQNK